MTAIEAYEAADLALGAGKTGALIIPTFDTGHVKAEWDKKNKAEVDAARETFVAMKSKGYLAFRVDPKSGEKGAQLKEFDPDAERIIMTPPFAGG
jgi:hypothetical protein